MIQLSETQKFVLKRLTDCGYEAFLVGGCVRDKLMGIESKDTDVTTNALPEQTMRVFSDMPVFLTGIKHGTITVIINKEPVEITTYRCDGAYSDNRHPDKVTFSLNIKEDLSRRDFTMNAIAYSLNDGLLDIFGGVSDIKNKVIRCVGNPQERFKEDALRIMRAIRFLSVLGFDIEDNTKAQLISNKDLLKHISAERLSSELSYAVCGKNIKNMIIMFPSVLDTFIDGFAKMENFNQYNPHHKYDLLTHVANVTAALEPTCVLRLTGLLHDIGKPKCFTRDENGIGHFYKHEHEGALAADTILKKLRFDNSTREKVVRLIKFHMYPMTNDEKCIKKLLSILGPDDFFDLIKIKIADTASHEDKNMPNKAFFDEIAEHAKLIIEKKECFSLKELAVNGNDMKEIGYNGKAVGNILNKLLSSVINGEIENNKIILMQKATILFSKKNTKSK